MRSPVRPPMRLRRRVWALLAIALLAASCTSEQPGDDGATHHTRHHRSHLGAGHALPGRIALAPTRRVSPAPASTCGASPCSSSRWRSRSARGDEALYVAEKVGRVVALRDDGAEPEVILDITGEVSQGSEQGLLGHRVRAERPVPLHQLHRRGGPHARGRVPHRGRRRGRRIASRRAVRRAAVLEPQRRQPRVRSRRLPVHRPGRRRQRRRSRRQRPIAPDAARQDAADLAEALR